MEDDEITPEMIEAGVSVYFANTPYFFEEREIVRLIYSAMRASRDGRDVAEKSHPEGQSREAEARPQSEA